MCSNEIFLTDDRSHLNNYYKSNVTVVAGISVLDYTKLSAHNELSLRRRTFQARLY